jgi:multiple sugar transport system substrate-binding protein
VRLALGLVVLLSACGHADTGDVTIRFWTVGREGEAVRAMIPAFERSHPGIHVRTQQIPFTAAHEKLLTAYVGDAMPDVAQIGNTWIAEFAALHALMPLTARADSADYYPGIWGTNQIGDTLYGVPWYVDTRLVFYRSDMLAAAGYRSTPTSWSAWRAAMRQIRANEGGGDRFAILLPVSEWATPVILGLEEGAPLLRDDGQYGHFDEPRFRGAFDYYVGLFRDSLAPTVNAAQVANRYQSFAAGDFAMTVTGPWDIGEFSHRLPPSLDGKWMTAPMPAPDGVAPPGVSIAGGSSLVLFRRSAHPDAARALIDYLSEPAQQLAFYRLTGDLPPRQSAWADSSLARNPYAAAFRVQLQHLAPLPKVPEIEQIVTMFAQYAEAVVRGAMTEDAALAALDRDVDRLLAKRRWLLHGH